MSVEIRRQIRLIEEAMRQAGVWSEQTPEWVLAYEGKTIPDIWQWMQFVYLPMRDTGMSFTPVYLAPQVRPYLNDVIHENTLLVQRIVELDSLTSVMKVSVRS
jgi:uncharacterized protein YqcC (DUF446 family)